MFTGTHIAIELQGDGLVNFRALAIADVAAQSLIIEAVLVIQQHRQPHA